MSAQGNLTLLSRLEAASRELGTLTLMKLYQDPTLQTDIVELQKLGLWYVASMTQGNITTAGAKALGWKLDLHFEEAVSPTVQSHPPGYEVMGPADFVDDAGDARFTNDIVRGLRLGSRDRHWEMVEYVRFSDCIAAYVGMSSMCEEIPLDVARWLLAD